MTHNLTNLEAARLLIAKLTDEDKWLLLGEQLEGPLCFDNQACVDATTPLTDAYYAAYESITDAVDAAMTDASDDYDGGRHDFAASRGLVSA